MAEQFINVRVNSQQAKKEFDDLTESIQLQKEFLAEGKLLFFTSSTYFPKASEIEFASFIKFLTNFGCLSQE